MKKIAIVCCMLLVAAALVTGSIAFFTDSVESNQNVVAAGTLDIEQHEYEDVNRETAALTAWDEEGSHPVYPSSIRAEDMDEEDERILLEINEADVKLFDKHVPGFVDKVVNVENVGTLIAYVRTFIAVPVCVTEDAQYEWLHLDLNREGWEWSAPFTAKIGEKDHMIYEGIYTAQLLPGKFTTPSLLGFYMNGSVGNDGSILVYKAADGKKYPLMDMAKEKLEILVKSEASQAIVFDNSVHALTVTFEGEGIENYHPWMK